MVRDCDTALCAASAREKAIACLSTDIRPRCNSKVRSDGNARGPRRTVGILAESRGSRGLTCEEHMAANWAANLRQYEHNLRVRVRLRVIAVQ